MPVPALALLMAPREGGSSAIVFIVEMILIFGIFYWLLIRPQRKEQQRHQEMIESLKKGDEVVTAGGIIGKIIHVENDHLTVRTGDDTRVVVARGKIARRAGDEEEE